MPKRFTNYSSQFFHPTSFPCDQPTDETLPHVGSGKLPSWTSTNYDAHVFVHHRINHLEITNKMRSCIRIYYSNVTYCSTCFERHIAHHQEFKLYLQPLVLHTSVVSGRWQPPATTDVCKTRGCKYILSSWWWAMCRSKHVEQ